MAAELRVMSANCPLRALRSLDATRVIPADCRRHNLLREGFVSLFGSWRSVLLGSLKVLRGSAVFCQVLQGSVLRGSTGFGSTGFYRVRFYGVLQGSVLRGSTGFGSTGFYRVRFYG